MPGSLLDSNTWIAVVFPTHPFHPEARRILTAATPAEPALFCRSTQQSFLRLLTTPALQKAYGAEGLTNRDALLTLDALLVLPQVSEHVELPGTVELWRSLAASDTASPKVWMDAYLAAFAITAKLRFVTLDRDFRHYTDRRLDLVLLHP